MLRQRELLLRDRLRERGGELLLRRPRLPLLRQRGLLLQERGGDLLLRWPRLLLRQLGLLLQERGGELLLL